MDDRTGQLVSLESGQKVPDGFHAVPAGLEEAARAELAGQQKAVVDPAGSGPMSQHLRDRRRMMQKRKMRRRRARKRKG